jgi:hypothetical protein
MRLDTDARGLLTINPFLPTPLVVTRNTSSSGTGRAVDVGAGLVIANWDLGFGVNGIGNRINWKDVEQTTYSMGNPFLGDSTFVETVPLPVGETSVELPVNYRGNVGYNADRWSAIAEAGRDSAAILCTPGTNIASPASSCAAAPATRVRCGIQRAESAST